MTSFLHHAIPHLRMGGAWNVADFLGALEEVTEVGGSDGRFVVRLGGTTAMVAADDILIGPRGMSVCGTPITIAFDATLRMGRMAPDHFNMPAQPSPRYRRTAFAYETGYERTFGMIARDDEIEPGRHSRESLTEAIAVLRRTASAEARSVVMTTTTRQGQTKRSEGVVLDEDGLRAQLGTRIFPWSRMSMFEISDTIRMSCEDALIEIAA